MKRKARGRRGRRSGRLLDPDKPKIIFTNPDILFLILGLQYHAEPFEALRRYETLILDEVRLYQGVELVHALAMVALAGGFGIFRRLVSLSPDAFRISLETWDALGMGPEAAPVLDAVRTHGHVTTAMVARQLKVSQDTAQRLVNKLVESGLIERGQALLLLELWRRKRQPE